MSARKIIVPVLVAAVALSLMTGLNAGQKQTDKKSDKQAQPQEKVFIPKEIKAMLAEGLATKQGRQDIPVSIFYSLFLPAQQNFHDVFFLKIKNSALGFAPLPAAPAAPGTPPVKGPQQSTPQEASQVLQANFLLFIQFNQLKEGAQPESVKEIYVPCAIQVPAAGFDKEAEDVYSFGYPMPAGHYLLAIAIASPDLKAVGTAYYDFAVPDPSEYTKALKTTPIFFVKEMEQMEGVESRTVLHRGFFTYSVLKIIPNLEKTFSAGQNLDIFFFIFGTQVNAQNQNDIEVNFEVKKGEEFVIRWAPQAYTNPLVSQPLPLKQTLNIKTGDQEKTETKDLAPGDYTLAVKITDKVSGKTAAESVGFTMK
ncbi:MAG: hypothetical protein A2W03_02540 [Candidatus Aminicenantes bacterium RBG_16_63_16]|nr:MAG: hypothetical protein A2W03_02540 [Candidatus Aminicenantes bacterium RBG_16_63_16]